FSSTFPNIKIVLGAHVVNYIVGKYITRNLNRLVANNTSKGDHCDLGGSSSYINDHISFRLHDIDPDTYCCGHGFMNKIYFLTVYTLCTFLNGTHFNFSYT